MDKEFLESIISDKIQESDTLEYKSYYFENGQFTKINSKKGTDPIYQTICAFANTNGGKIVIGVKEDENHNPCELCDVGVNEETMETWEQAFRNKLNVSIIPSIYNVHVDLVEVSPDINCIIINVPKSVIKPHVYNDSGNNHKFYARNGNTNKLMLYNDIKNSFDALNNRTLRLNNFRNERIASILNGEVEDNFLTSTLLLLHIFPENSLDESTFIDLKSCEYNKDLSFFNPLNSNGEISYNADGLFKANKNYNGFLSSYIQIFSNGCIESGERYLVDNYEDTDNLICQWDELELILAKRVYGYCINLYNKNIGGRFYISFTFLNSKDCYTRLSPFSYFSDPIKKNIIKSPFVLWDINKPFSKEMYQLFNRFANIFGQSESSLYNNGQPIEDKFDFIKPIINTNE